jgi:hypothetical protein
MLAIQNNHASQSSGCLLQAVKKTNYTVYRLHGKTHGENTIELSKKAQTYLLTGLTGKKGQIRKGDSLLVKKYTMFRQEQRVRFHAFQLSGG